MARTQTATATGLLARSETLTVTPDKHFAAADFFKVWDMGDNFRREFLDVVEDTDGAPVEIDLDTLQRYSLDKPIITEMGGIATAAIPLSLYAAIAKTGRSFIAYVKKGKVAWAVSCLRDGDYRNVEASSVKHPREWVVGRRFASRSSRRQS